MTNILNQTVSFPAAAIFMFLHQIISQNYLEALSSEMIRLKVVLFDGSLLNGEARRFSDNFACPSKRICFLIANLATNLAVVGEIFIYFLE